MQEQSVSALFAAAEVAARSGDAAAALALIDRALEASGEAQEFFEMAAGLMRMRRPKRALAAVDRGLALAPHTAAGHARRARILRALQEQDAAVASAARAVELAPRSAGAWRALGVAYAGANRLPRAAAAFRQSVALGGGDAATLANFGCVLTQLQHYAAALEAFDRALQLDPVSAQARWNRGLCLLALGRFDEGLDDYEARLAIDDVSFERARADGALLWRKGEAIAGRRLLLYNDQGHGDTIQFIRFAPILRALGAEVIAEVQSELAELCASIDPAVRIVRQRETAPVVDLVCPMASLPHRLSLTVATIPAEVPYLRADAARVAAWRGRLAPLSGLRVGLAWAGNARHANDANRSIALEALAPLFAAPGVSFVSLQKELRAGDASLIARWGIADHTALMTDFSETAALMANLDLVITVDTSIAHLAGALARPTWIFVPFAADFRWLAERADSPWYPTARLLRQPRFRDWSGAIEEASTLLRRGFAGFRPS
jgi:tetratricopeptide (TPR) repeat protein